MRSALPSLQSAVTSIMPPGASSIIVVCGSVIGTMPVSSSTVATHIEFEPDIGGVSCGSITIQPVDRPRVLGRHEQAHVAEDAAARLVEHEVAQRLVGRDEVALLPDRVARRRQDAAHDDVADFPLGVRRDDVDEL